MHCQNITKGQEELNQSVQTIDSFNNLYLRSITALPLIGELFAALVEAKLSEKLFLIQKHSKGPHHILQKKIEIIRSYTKVNGVNFVISCAFMISLFVAATFFSGGFVQAALIASCILFGIMKMITLISLMNIDLKYEKMANS